MSCCVMEWIYIYIFWDKEEDAKRYLSTTYLLKCPHPFESGVCEDRIRNRMWHRASITHFWDWPVAGRVTDLELLAPRLIWIVLVRRHFRPSRALSLRCLHTNPDAEVMVSQQSELTKFNEREMPHLPSTFRLDRLVRHLIRHSSTRWYQ
jgi:hypothetical protein